MTQTQEDHRELANEVEEEVRPESRITDFCRDIDRPEVQAWVRLPNPFQYREIVQKARAARARRVMQYRDANSDLSVIVEERVDDMFAEHGTDAVVEWLTGRHNSEAMTEALAIVNNTKEGKKYVWEDAIDHERAYRRLLDMGLQSTDEFEKVHDYLERYGDEIKKEMEKYIAPYREAYGSLNDDDLRNKVKRAIIKADCDDESINIYHQWQMFYGTRTVEDHDAPLFLSFDAMLRADEPILLALLEEFAELDALKSIELKKSHIATPSFHSFAQSVI